MTDPISQFRKEVPCIADKSNFIRLCCSGPSDVGKSAYIQYLYDEVFKYHYDLIIVMCKSDDQRLQYKHGMHTNLVYADFRADVIDKIIQNNRGVKPVRCLIILDDIIDRASRWNKSIFDLAISGRHNLISLCIVCHSLALLDPVVRNSLSHLCIPRQTNELTYEIIFNEYLMMLARCEYPDKTTAEIRRGVTNYMHASTANWNILFISLLDIKRTNKSLKQILQITNSRDSEKSEKGKDKIPTVKSGKLEETDSETEDTQEVRE